MCGVVKEFGTEFKFFAFFFHHGVINRKEQRLCG